MSKCNIISGVYVTYENESDDVIIDSNAKIKEILERQEKEYKMKLLEQERERRIQELEASGEQIPEGVSVDEFLGLADSIMQKGEESPEPEIDYVAEAMAKADEIIAQAQADAQGIIDSAQTEADAMKNMAYQEGEKEGYNHGLTQAANELSQEKEMLHAKVAEIKQEYYDKMNSLEHEIVEQCMDVFKKVFSCELSGDSQIIYHLLDKCLMNIERSKQMQIKVSEKNVEYLKTKKEDILSKIGSDVILDFVYDPLLDDGQCLIETDGGVFDCSIDTELDALIRDIKALS